MVEKALTGSPLKDGYIAVLYQCSETETDKSVNWFKLNQLTETVYKLKTRKTEINRF